MVKIAGPTKAEIAGIEAAEDADARVLTTVPDLTPAPLPSKITRKIREVAERAKGLTINSKEEYAAAGEFLTTKINAQLEYIDELLAPGVRARHKAHKDAVEHKREAEAPLVEARGYITNAMRDWNRREEARVNAERKQLEESMHASAEAEKVAEIARLASVGREDEANALIAEVERGVAVAVPMVAVPYKPQKVAGVASRKTQKYRIVAPEKIKREYMMPNDKLIQGMVTLHKKAAEEMVGGIEWYEDDGLASGAR